MAPLVQRMHHGGFFSYRRGRQLERFHKNTANSKVFQVVDTVNGNAVGRRMEILLVEQNCSDARLTFAFLKPKQYRLTWLENGEEAMEFLHRDG